MKNHVNPIFTFIYDKKLIFLVDSWLKTHFSVIARMCSAYHKSMELRKETFFSRVQFAICVIKSSNLIIFNIIDISSYETKNGINVFRKYLLDKEIFNQKVHFSKNVFCKHFPSKTTFSLNTTRLYLLIFIFFQMESTLSSKNMVQKNSKIQ